MTKDGTNPVGRLTACAVTVRQAPQSDFLWLALSFGKIYICTVRLNVFFFFFFCDVKDRAARSKTIWNTS